MSPRLVGLVVERNRRFRQIVEQCFERFVIERQPVLHAGMPPPGADRLVKRVIAADRAELLAIARAEALDRRIVEQDLADRAQDELVERSGRALRQRVEAA